MGVLKIQPALTDIANLCKKDKCYQALQAQLEKLKGEQSVATGQQSAAWKEALQAFSRWAKVKMRPHKHAEKIEAVKTSLRKRRAYVLENASRNTIYALRVKMGPKFNRLNADLLPKETSPEL